MNRLELAKKIAIELFGLKYKSDYSTRGIPVIDDDNKKLVLETIISTINDDYDNELSKLEAKVYAYEQIIAKSNFAPILQKKVEVEE